MMDLIDNLTSATTSVDRNDAALRILDMYKEANVSLIDMLRDPALDGEKGTILYVLNEMYVKVPIELLVDLLTGDGYSTPSYEIQQKALTQICQRTEAHTTAEEVGRAQRHLYFWPVQSSAVTTAQLALRELNFYNQSPTVISYQQHTDYPQEDFNSPVF